MRPDLREWVVLVALAASFCVCFLIEPDWNVSEAHRLCDGEPTQVAFGLGRLIRHGAARLNV